jgi:catechol 2,3-dioxygenase-like lactoylglutathione lyase family enzyme
VRTRIHVSLQVADLDRSIAFYTRLFGTGPSKLRGDYANWRLDEPALHLALVHAPGAPRKTTHEHFGVELFEGEDLASWQQRAAAAGLALRTEEQVTCCYAVADKFWAQDPDGHEWEFWVRSEEAEAMRGAAMPTTTGASVCCAPTATKPADAAGSPDPDPC